MAFREEPRRAGRKAAPNLGRRTVTETTTTTYRLRPRPREKTHG